MQKPTGAPPNLIRLRNWSLPPSPSQVVPAGGPDVVGWAIYTDGSGPSEGHPYVGWRVGIWESRLTSCFPDFALWGPVPVERWDPRWLGALQPTNNTAEVTAIAEDTEAPGPEHIPATLWYDSTYSFDAITRDHYPEHNTELILKVRELLQTVSAKRVLDFQKVKCTLR